MIIEILNKKRSEIIFMTIVEKPTNILTIDKDGKIFLWEYNEAYLNPDSTFQTRERFKFLFTYKKGFYK